MSEVLHPTVRVVYSCDACGLIDREVQVQARLSQSEPLDSWAGHHLGPTVAADHAEQSPHCWMHQVSRVSFPDSSFPGGPRVQ